MLRRMAVAAALGTLGVGGCGGANGTPTDSSTPAPTPTVTIAATPSEATATASTDPNYQWATSFSLSLSETAGVAVTIRNVSANLQQAAGGIVVTPPAGLSAAFRYEVRSAGNRLAANGTTAMSVGFFYTLPQPGQEALATLSFTLVDDSGNVYTQTVQVKVV